MIVSGNYGNGVTLDSGTSGSTVINNVIGYASNGEPLYSTGTQFVQGGTGNTIDGNVVARFAAGTRIRTARGAVAVEELGVGDRVRTVLGRRWERIVWIGHRATDCRRHPRPESVRPVRIAAGAFGRRRPARNFLLSPDHAVFVDGVLIPVRRLVNGSSIAQLEAARVTYYHVELARHDVLLAEELQAESYLDTGDRDNFGDAGAARGRFRAGRDAGLGGGLRAAIGWRAAAQRKPIESQGTAATRMTARSSAPR